MKKYILSGAVVLAFLLYVVKTQLNFGDDDVKVIPPASNNTTIRNAPPPATTPTPAATPPPVSTGQYKNGTYTGTVADAYFGNLQVQVTIIGGKISDVVFLQYPNDRSTSREINSQAMPYLRQEAIKAQSASVDVVSGATLSSLAFRESLTSALNQAHS